jgi:hypothetical protein
MPHETSVKGSRHSPARPSPRPWPPGDSGAPPAFPWAPHPHGQDPRTHAREGTGSEHKPSVTSGPSNEPGDGSPQAEDDYFDPALIRGSLNLSYQGCGYMVRLVLNGPQRGTLWEDRRCSDMGISPFGPDFATWYLQWLRDPKPT